MILRAVRLILLFTLIWVVGFSTSLRTHADTPGSDIDSAIRWIGTLQNADGGFTDGSKPDSNVETTADAVIAIASAGQDPTTLAKGNNTPLTYLQAQIQGGKVTTVRQFAKILRAANESGWEDIHNFAGADLGAKTSDALM